MGYNREHTRIGNAGIEILNKLTIKLEALRLSTTTYNSVQVGINSAGLRCILNTPQSLLENLKELNLSMKNIIHVKIN